MNIILNVKAVVDNVPKQSCCHFCGRGEFETNFGSFFIKRIEASVETWTKLCKIIREKDIGQIESVFYAVSR